MKPSSKPRFLFQGDSITDCDRNYADDRDLGTGYVMMAARLFSARHPEISVSFINRGISGNKVRDLKKRWQKDCLDLRPDVITILIGVNDISKVFLLQRTTSNESFEEDYRAILEQTRNRIRAKLVLMEPFMLTGGNRSKLREKLFPKIEIIGELALEFSATLVPLSKIFLNAEKAKGPAFWSNDGFHPTVEGHQLIAESWIRAVDKN
jgi:lysophospholipase L1-like esterase